MLIFNEADLQVNGTTVKRVVSGSFDPNIQVAFVHYLSQTTVDAVLLPVSRPSLSFTRQFGSDEHLSPLNLAGGSIIPAVVGGGDVSLVMRGKTSTSGFTVGSTYARVTFYGLSLGVPGTLQESIGLTSRGFTLSGDQPTITPHLLEGSPCTHARTSIVFSDFTMFSDSNEAGVDIINCSMRVDIPWEVSMGFGSITPENLTMLFAPPARVSVELTARLPGELADSTEATLRSAVQDQNVSVTMTCTGENGTCTATVTGLKLSTFNVAHGPGPPVLRLQAMKEISHTGDTSAGMSVAWA